MCIQQSKFMMILKKKDFFVTFFIFLIMLVLRTDLERTATHRQYLKFTFSFPAPVDASYALKTADFILKKSAFKLYSSDFIGLNSNRITLIKNSPNEFIIEKFNEKYLSIYQLLESYRAEDKNVVELVKLGKIKVLTSFQSFSIISLREFIRNFVFSAITAFFLKEVIFFVLEYNKRTD